MWFAKLVTSGLFLTEIFLLVLGLPVNQSEISNRSCLQIRQPLKLGNHTTRILTTVEVEEIIGDAPVEEFFLPEAPRSIILEKLNTSQASLHITPSRAGLDNLDSYLLRIIQDALGPKEYIQYRLIDLRNVRLRQDSSVIYSCIDLYPQVYRLYVKVWALSINPAGPASKVRYVRSKYSTKMSNYLSLSTQTDTTKALVLKQPQEKGRDIQSDAHVLRQKIRHSKRTQKDGCNAT